MNQHQRNRENWIANFGSQFLAIWNDPSLTRTERLNKLNESGIPTLRTTKKGWTLTNTYRMYNDIVNRG